MENDNGVVQFEPNIPQLIRLKYPNGFTVNGRNGGQRVMYTLTDGRKLFVDPDVAGAIKLGEYQPGQAFTITKRVGSNRQVRWDVDPCEVAEGGPSFAPTRPAPPHADASSRATTSPQYAPPANQTQDRSTGTYGPAPQRQPMPPMKVPANVAFGEIVAFVKGELEARGEQWNDEARQAAVCTMFIEAGKQGWLAPWERAAR